MAKEIKDKLMSFTNELQYDVLVFTEIIKPLRLAQVRRDEKTYFKLFKSFFQATSFFIAEKKAQELLTKIQIIEKDFALIPSKTNMTKEKEIKIDKLRGHLMNKIEELEREYNRRLQGIGYFKKQYVDIEHNLGIPMRDNE